MAAPAHTAHACSNSRSKVRFLSGSEGRAALLQVCSSGLLRSSCLQRASCLVPTTQ